MDYKQTNSGLTGNKKHEINTMIIGKFVYKPTNLN